MFELNTHVCDIGALHVEGVVISSGTTVSEVKWPEYVKSGWSECQFISNHKLLVWGSAQHEAALQAEAQGEDIRDAVYAAPIPTPPVVGRKTDISLLALFDDAPEEPVTTAVTQTEDDNDGTKV